MALPRETKESHHGLMFVRCYAELSYPFAEVKGAALSRPRRWLDIIPGATDGESFRCDVSPGPGWQEVRKQVWVHLGQPELEPGQLTIPMSWTATAAGGLFPKLEGWLRFAEVQPGLTLLSLLAEYEPPLGAVGRFMDNLLLHRVAWATLREFNQHVAANLDEAVQMDRKVVRLLAADRRRGANRDKGKTVGQST